MSNQNKIPIFAIEINHSKKNKMENLIILKEQFKIAEAKFDAKPNSKTAENLKEARAKLESAEYQANRNVDYENRLAESQLKVLENLGRGLGLSL